MTWDIQPNMEQEYFKFLIREFVPKMNRLGFELSDAWATVYGEQPQVEICAVLPDETEAEKRMEQPEWQDLLDQLSGFVINFKSKVVPAKSGFQF